MEFMNLHMGTIYQDDEIILVSPLDAAGHLKSNAMTPELLGKSINKHGKTTFYAAGIDEHTMDNIPHQLGCEPHKTLLHMAREEVITAGFRISSSNSTLHENVGAPGDSLPRY